MYQEFILFIIIIIIILQNVNTNTKYTKANNGIEYLVQISPDSINKANMLAVLDNRVNDFVKYVGDNKLPTKIISKRFINRMKSVKLKETPYNESGAGYTINKGDIYLCLVNKETQILNDVEDVMFVLMHELAHTMSTSYGHGPEFKTNFDFIVKLCVKLKLWKSKDYSKKNVEICGVNVTNGNCDNGACSKDSLDYYFRESLLSD